METPPKKKGRRRPPVLTMPERIDAPPEKIAKVTLRAKPKKVWAFEEEAKKPPH